MSGNDLSSFRAGGYFLTRLASRTTWMAPDLVPERIVTLSHCLTSMIPDNWALKLGGVSRRDRMCGAEKCGISRDTAKQLTRWSMGQLRAGNLGFPNVCMNLAMAQQCREMFLDGRTDWSLVGVGLPTRHVPTFLEYEKPGRGVGVPGVYSMLSRQLALEPDGVCLGYEILGFECAGFHTWYCNRLEAEICSACKCHPNSYGLLDTLESAEKGAEYASRDDVKADPLLWLPWLVVKYS